MTVALYTVLCYTGPWYIKIYLWHTKIDQFCCPFDKANPLAGVLTCANHCRWRGALESEVWLITSIDLTGSQIITTDMLVSPFTLSEKIVWELQVYPDSKVHGASMGPIWGRQDPGGPHVGPMNFAIWVKLWYAIHWANAYHTYFRYTCLRCKARTFAYWSWLCCVLLTICSSVFLSCIRINPIPIMWLY